MNEAHFKISALFESASILAEKDAKEALRFRWKRVGMKLNLPMNAITSSPGSKSETPIYIQRKNMHSKPSKSSLSKSFLGQSPTPSLRFQSPPPPHPSYPPPLSPPLSPTTLAINSLTTAVWIARAAWNESTQCRFYLVMLLMLCSYLGSSRYRLEARWQLRGERGGGTSQTHSQLKDNTGTTIK